jgi:large subunit ribosomal protein L21
MYAVIETAGRQFKVSQGDVIVLEGKDKKVGDELVFDRVLANDKQLGTPTVAGAKVTGKVVFAGKGEKLYIQKYRARKQYRRRTGFRASIFRVKITDITG